MASYALARAAVEDLEVIDRYTFATWGAEQRDKYIRALFSRFEQLAATPGVGRARPELAEDVRSFPHEQHVVFYEVRESCCYVLRVLHHRRDVNSAFAASQP